MSILFACATAPLAFLGNADLPIGSGVPARGTVSACALGFLRSPLVTHLSPIPQSLFSKTVNCKPPTVDCLPEARP
jgi:hypothetical protein